MLPSNGYSRQVSFNEGTLLRNRDTNFGFSLRAHMKCMPTWECYIYEASWANQGCRNLEVLDGWEQYRNWINKEHKTDTHRIRSIFFWVYRVPKCQMYLHPVRFSVCMTKTQINFKNWHQQSSCMHYAYGWIVVEQVFVFAIF